MASTQDRLTTLGSGGSIAWAVLLIVCGVLAIALPFEMSIGVVLLMAWLIIFSGGIQLVHAFQSKGAGSVAWKLIVSILYLIAGVYFLLNPLLGVASFTLLLACFFIAEGVIDLYAYFKHRGLDGAGWILLDGAITLLLGILVGAHWPSSSAYVIGTLVGISMIMTGTSRLMMSLAARRLSKAKSEPAQITDRVA